MVHALAALVFVCGCGASEPPFSCPSDSFATDGSATPRVACQAAQAFAARDTQGILPMQSEVDRYFGRWLAAVVAEPILDRRVPQRHYVGYGSPIAIYTANPVVIDAWSQGVIETGDSAFDSVIAELPAPRRVGGSKIDFGGGWYLFSIDVRGTFNEALLDARLRTVSSRIDEPKYSYRDDGTWGWQSGAIGTGSDMDIAQIDFSFGWGDCFVACSGMHDLRAVVPPDGDAKVYDMGGDPLPDGWQLSPNTQPWP